MDTRARHRRICILFLQLSKFITTISDVILSSYWKILVGFPALGLYVTKQRNWRVTI